MSETDDRFRPLQEVEAPDLWPEIGRRADSASSPAGLGKPRRTRRVLLVTLGGVVLLAWGAIAATQLGEDQDLVETATVPSPSSTTASPETSTTGLVQPGTDVDFSMLFAGPAPGVSDVFVRFDNLSVFLDATSLSAVVRFVDYELDPAPASPDIYVPGYAGPQGVMRLYFVVEEVVGGSDASIMPAPGRSGELVAVDVEYWIDPDAQPEHFGALDKLKGRPERLVLFLGAGLIGQARTGTYTLWTTPSGTFVEDDVGGQLRLVLPDYELVSREAVERGLDRTMNTHASDEHESVPPETVAPPKDSSLDPVPGVEGLTVEQLLAQHQQPAEARPSW